MDGSQWSQGPTEHKPDPLHEMIEKKLKALHDNAEQQLVIECDRVQTRFNDVINTAVNKAVSALINDGMGNIDLAPDDIRKPIHLFESDINGYYVQADFVLTETDPIPGDYPKRRYKLMLTVFGFDDYMLKRYIPARPQCKICHVGLGSYGYDHFTNTARLGINL